MTTTIVIADDLGGGIADRVRAQFPGSRDYNIIEQPTDLVSALNGAQVLIVRSATKVTKELLGSVADLKLDTVIRAGVDTENIDIKACTARRITVKNTPKYSAAAVAELTVAMILTLVNGVIPNVVAMRVGEWNKSIRRSVSEVDIAIVGFGNIGKAVARFLTPFEPKSLAYFDPPLEAVPPGFEHVGRLESLIDVARSADVITIHAPLIPATRGMIDREFLSAMREKAILLNLSKAGVVGQAALLEIVQTGRIIAYSDVFANEPKENKSRIHDPLLACSNLYATSHIGAQTRPARDGIGHEILEMLEARETSHTARADARGIEVRTVAPHAGANGTRTNGHPPAPVRAPLVHVAAGATLRTGR